MSCSQNKVPLNKDPSTWMYSPILDWHHVRSGVGLCLPATDYAALSSPLQESKGQIKTATTENSSFWPLKKWETVFQRRSKISCHWNSASLLTCEGDLQKDVKDAADHGGTDAAGLQWPPPLHTSLFITRLPQQKLCGQKFLHGYHTFVCTAACNRWWCITHLQSFTSRTLFLFSGWYKEPGRNCCCDLLLCKYDWTEWNATWCPLTHTFSTLVLLGWC